MTARHRPLRLRWAAYAVVVATQLISLWFGVSWLHKPAQILLMPVLALVAMTARPGPLRTWTLVALFFSFLGDTLPRFIGEPWDFIAMLTPFLIAHVAWVIALWRIRPPRPWLLVPYLAVAIGVITWTLPGTGTLGPAVVVYAAAITATAVLAAGLGWPGIAGGAFYVISDSLIAAQNFTTFTFPQADVAVMAAYTLAQGLLVWGVLLSPGTREGVAYAPRLGWHTA